MYIEQPESIYDLVIVGGGLVGASFALQLDCLLADVDCRVLVVEAVAPDHDSQPSFDARSTALSWGSRSVFESMGLWSQLQDEVATIERIQVSDQGHLGLSQLDCEEQNVAALGYVAENRVLGSVLGKALAGSSRLQVLAPARIESIQPRADGMVLTIQPQQEKDRQLAVNASLVVLADGGRSPICQQLGIQQTSESYEQCAVITNIALQNSHANTAFERFTDTGPLAVLPLKDFDGSPRCSLVWTVKSGDEDELIHCPDEAFIRKLTAHFGSRLGRIEKTGQRFAYPLTLSTAKEQIRPGLVLLGNVAHTLHPVAGQGFNLSLRDAAALARLICDGMANGKNPGDMKLLQSYLDSREADQQQAILFTDQMTRLFSSARPGKVLVRKAGLLSLDLVPMLRKEFARRAMGTVHN